MKNVLKSVLNFTILVSTVSLCDAIKLLNRHRPGLKEEQTVWIPGLGRSVNLIGRSLSGQDKNRKFLKNWKDVKKKTMHSFCNIERMSIRQERVYTQ